ncbi:hypothetical protein ACIQU6_15905 [Streptomyces sp. NPDC090442]|uniref:hypothetical protein n=1 Tax=Streptomyces sp. NPDC090442 TaxID=3365962 RepID=UPI003818BBC4
MSAARSIRAGKAKKTARYATNWASTTLPIGLGAMAMVVGVWLLVFPFPEAMAAARAYDAAIGCPHRAASGEAASDEARSSEAESAEAASGDCLSGVDATVQRSWTRGSRPVRQYLEFAREDGTRQELRLDRGTYADAPANGTRVRLVSWRGEVRHINYRVAGTRDTAGTTRTLFTDANPRTAHALPLAWGLGLTFGGPALLWFGCLARRHAPDSPPRDVLLPGTLPPTVLVLVAVSTGAIAIQGDPVADTLRQAGFLALGGLLLAPLLAWYAAPRRREAGRRKGQLLSR